MLGVPLPSQPERGRRRFGVGRHPASEGRGFGVEIVPGQGVEQVKTDRQIEPDTDRGAHGSLQLGSSALRGEHPLESQERTPAVAQ